MEQHDINKNIVQLVGGAKDGEILAIPTIFPELIFRSLRVNFRMVDDPIMTLPIETITYRRLGDTLIYICIDWYSE